MERCVVLFRSKFQPFQSVNCTFLEFFFLENHLNLDFFLKTYCPSTFSLPKSFPYLNQPRTKIVMLSMIPSRKKEQVMFFKEDAASVIFPQSNLDVSKRFGLDAQKHIAIATRDYTPVN